MRPDYPPKHHLATCKCNVCNPLKYGDIIKTSFGENPIQMKIKTSCEMSVKKLRPSDSLAYRRINKLIHKINLKTLLKDEYEMGRYNALREAREILRKSIKEESNANKPRLSHDYA